MRSFSSERSTSCAGPSQSRADAAAQAEIYRPGEMEAVVVVTGASRFELWRAAMASGRAGLASAIRTIERWRIGNRKEAPMGKGESRIHEENDDVRITEWRLQPGAATGYHRHDYDYVVVPLTAGRIKAAGPAGESQMELRAGEAYFRKAGVEHDVINVGNAVYTFVEVEMKRQPG
jgi:quercetin dioxygenase-like cupin family protein